VTNKEVFDAKRRLRFLLGDLERYMPKGNGEGKHTPRRDRIEREIAELREKLSSEGI
jgi:hypothetical protein